MELSTWPCLHLTLVEGMRMLFSYFWEPLSAERGEGGGVKNSMEWQMRWIKWLVMLKLEHTFVWPTYAPKTTSQHIKSLN